MSQTTNESTITKITAEEEAPKEISKDAPAVASSTPKEIPSSDQSFERSEAIEKEAPKDESIKEIQSETVNQESDEIKEIQKEVAEENQKDEKSMNDQEEGDEKKRKRDEIEVQTNQELSPEKKMKTVATSACSQEHNSQSIVHNSQEINCQ